MEDQLMVHLGSSAIVVWLIQLLKASKWFPMISADTAKLNSWISTLVAAALAIGVTIQTSGYTFHSGGTISINIPSSHQLLEVLVRFAGQRVMQLGIYKGVVSQQTPSSPPAQPVAQAQNAGN